jgi:hypothetical protein
MTIYTKNILVFTFILLVQAIHGQDICQELATLKKGTVIEYANYNKKDKYESGQILTVASQSVTKDGVYSDIESVILDKKKNESMAFNLVMECKNNTFYIDLRNLLDPSVYQSMSSLEIEWSGVPNGYPGNMKVGDKLEDSQLVMDVKSGGTKLMGMTINIVDQEVVGKESITTPAGTFECFKIVSTTEIKSHIK